MASPPAAPVHTGASTGVRAAVAALLLSGLHLGVWAAISPTGFYASFPGLGHHWVRALGTFNEHLLRDVGAFSLALTALAAFALLRPTREVLRATGIAWLTWGGMHLAYHLTKLGTLDGTDDALQVGAMVGTVALSILIVVRPGPHRTSGPDRAPQG